jgi:sporulation protein YunB
MFLISLLIFLGLTFQTFYYIEKNIEPVLHSIARIRAEQMATKAIHDAINQKIIKETDFKKLIDIKEDKDGKVQVATFNSNEYTRIVFESTENVMHALKDMETTPEKIKLGQALRSNLLAQLGPELPITLVPYGNVHVELDTKMQQAGINMVLITVFIIIETKVKIVIPFSTQPAVVQSEVPISNALIVGDVPQFYYDGTGKPVGSEVPGVQPPPILPPVQMNTTKIQE